MADRNVALSGRVVVMDDDTAFLQLMHVLLEEEGLEVLICREWDSAHEFVKEQHPDLIILDIRIGAEELGWTVLELLTLDPATRPVPVIVCSAAIQALHEHQPWLDKFGICALPKPFDLRMLTEMVARGLNQPVVHGPGPLYPATSAPLPRSQNT